MDYQTENKHIAECLKELNLSSLKENLDLYESRANDEKWTYRQFLGNLLHLEWERRLENRKRQRIKRANFPELKYLVELEREELPAEGRAVLPELETLNFIREKRNVVMYGNPGTGKTHIAIALGIKACMEGCTVLFTSASSLLVQIREARSERTLKALQEKFLRYDLVIVDEFGYVSFDKEGGETIFNHVSLRSGKKSTITTTNLPFTRWDEIIKDKALCSALVDRLCHKAYLINMTGQSYRVKETQKMLSKL